MTKLILPRPRRLEVEHPDHMLHHRVVRRYEPQTLGGALLVDAGESDIALLTLSYSCKSPASRNAPLSHTGF